MITGKDLYVTVEWEHEGKKYSHGIKISAEEYLNCDTLEVFSPDDNQNPRIKVKDLFRTVKVAINLKKEGK